MVRSLRQHGGLFADSPVIAVTPRFGPPLSKKTLRAFEDLNVTYLRRSVKTEYPWFKFLNKPLAMVMAEEVIKTEAMGFLDSDLLIVDEPTELLLQPNEDFLGFPVECREMGTTGPGSTFDPLWQQFCRVLDIDIEALPFVRTAQTNELVRLYYNSGIFVYRKSTGFSRSYLDICLKLLDSRIITKAEGFGEGIKEMSAVGFSVIKLGLRYRHLPYSHDYVMTSGTHESWYREEVLRDAKIIHYHDSMWPHFFPVFIECLRKTHPDVEKWLAPLGPMRNEAPPQWRLINNVLKARRAKAETAYQQRCLIV
jgi:hypothetical protein